MNQGLPFSGSPHAQQEAGGQVWELTAAEAALPAWRNTARCGVSGKGRLCAAADLEGVYLFHFGEGGAMTWELRKIGRQRAAVYSAAGSGGALQ